MNASAIARVLFATLGLAASAAPAAALNIADFYESCFSQSYDAAYLAKHPGQRVGAMRAEIIDWGDNPFVRIHYTLRNGKTYLTGGDCYDAIQGGFTCHRCKDESCATGDQTFKLLLKSRNAIVFVNDTTGLSAKNDDGGIDTLPAGGEHGAFALSRTAASACQK